MRPSPRTANLLMETTMYAAATKGDLPCLLYCLLYLKHKYKTQNKYNGGT